MSVIVRDHILMTTIRRQKPKSCLCHFAVGSWRSPCPRKPLLCALVLSLLELPGVEHTAPCVCLSAGTMPLGATCSSHSVVTLSRLTDGSVPTCSGLTTRPLLVFRNFEQAALNIRVHVFLYVAHVFLSRLNVEAWSCGHRARLCLTL